MQRFFLTTLFLFWLAASALGQSFWRIEGKSLFELKREQQQILPQPRVFILFPNSSFLTLATLSIPRQNSFLYDDATPIPKAYRYQDLAFFCRIEVQMEQLFKMPVKFRLGEVEYVERMEGKY